MKKITLIFTVFFAVMFSGYLSAQQHDFASIPGPTLVTQGSPITLNINDVGNTASVPLPPSGTYSSFSVTVDWADNDNAFSSEADLRMTTTAGSILIDPATTGSAGSGAATTMTFEGEFTAPYDPSVDGFMDIVLRQSWSGSSANWSNIVVTIFPSPTCIAPDGLSVANITTNSVDLTWNVGANTDFEYAIQLAGTGEPSVNGIYADTTQPLTATDDVNYNPLVPSTAYEVWVRADCGANGYSTWFGPVNFATACTAFSVPFTEGFNSTSTTEFCWTILNTNADGDSWNTNYTSNPFEGDQSAAMYTDGNGGNNNDWLISPTITLTGNQRLKFHYRVQSATEPNDFELLLSTSGTAPASFTNTLIANTSYNNTTYIEQIVDLSAYSGDVNIAWHVPNGGLDGWRLYIDNVIIEDLPACVEPSNLTASNVTATSVDLNWNDLAGTTNYEYAIQAAGTGEPAANGVFADYASLPLTATDDVNYSPLTPSTAYEVWVRADCGGNGYSTWVGPVNFTTSSLVTCGTPENVTYCYTNNDTTSWTYTSNDGSPLRVTFNAGEVEVSWDELIVYDSDGTTELYNGYGNSGDLTGLVFDSSGDSIIIQITSDGSGSCSGGGYTSWDFTVACATCVNPAATLTAVPDCGNAQYSIDVDLTSLGSATSVTISDGTTTLTNISATGVQTFGPYADGASATIIITNEQDGSCSYSSGAFSYSCPPVNDECDNAVLLTVNADLNCGVVTAGTTVAATDSGIEPTFTVSGTPDNDVWFSFVATGTAHRISLSNVIAVVGTSTNMGMAVFDGSGTCSSLALVGSSDPNTYNVTGLTPTTTYYVSVYGWGAGPGAQATFNICVGTPPAPPANDDCANAIDVTMPYVNTQDATGATNNAGFISQCGGMNDGVWYTVDGDGGDITVAVTGVTGWDPEIGVYTGSCGAFTCVGSADSGGTGTGETYVITNSIDGETYYINIGNWSGSTNNPEGPLTIEVTTSLSSSTFDTANFKAYPNPVRDILNLEYKSEMSNVQVINLLGQTVINRAVNATSTQVDMSQLNAGAYIVNVTVDGAIQTIKVVKQ